MDVNKHLNKKLIQTLIYSGELHSMLEDPELKKGLAREEFLEALNEFICDNKINPHIEIKHLVYLRDLVNEIRFTDRSTMNTCNQMISNLNLTKTEDNKLFVKKEFIKRFSLNPFIGNNLQIFANYVLPQIHEQHIISSVAYDFILLDHLIWNELTEMDEVLENINGLEHHSISTINATLKECPVLFEDETFRTNSKLLLTYLKEQEEPNIKKRAKHSLKRI